jgi:crotonobetainyl-CoA:carnitine CoA-transferase CaiB-like acyl-CoA transferase
MGNDNFTAAPSGVFRTKDGYINIAANKQEQWESVCDALRLPELKTDTRFRKRDVRKQNRKELTPLLEVKLAERGTKEWVELLNANGVPSGAILSLEDALKQPQIKHRETLKDVVVEGIPHRHQDFRRTPLRYWRASASRRTNWPLCRRSMLSDSD